MGGTRFIYIAEPIDQRGESDRAQRWATKARESASAAGVGAFSPAQAFSVPEAATPDRYIQNVNHQAIANSSGLLALLPAGVPSIGVPMEIERAYQQGIPVAVVTDGPMWVLVGRPGLEVFELKRYEGDEDEAVLAAVLHLVNSDYTREARMRQLPFAPVGEPNVNKKLPTRAYDDDAGLDLYVSESVCIPSGQFRDVPCGIAVQMERHHWGLIIGRSSTLRTRGLLVAPGIIDPGYRGELFAGCQNVGPHAQTLQVGDRVAQLILMGNQTQSMVPRMVDRLQPHPRGERGFGSSGT